MKQLSKFLVAVLAVAAVFLLIAAGPPNGILNLRIDTDANGNHFSFTNLAGVGTAGLTVYHGDGSQLSGIVSVTSTNGTTINLTVVSNFVVNVEYVTNIAYVNNEYVTNITIFNSLTDVSAVPNDLAIWLSGGELGWTNSINAVIDGDAEYMTNVLLSAINPGSLTTGLIVSNSVSGGVSTLVLVRSPTGGGGGGSQTPLTSDIDAAQFAGTNYSEIIIEGDFGTNDLRTNGMTLYDDMGPSFIGMDDFGDGIVSIRAAGGFVSIDLHTSEDGGGSLIAENIGVHNQLSFGNEDIFTLNAGGNNAYLSFLGAGGISFDALSERDASGPIYVGDVFAKHVYASGYVSTDQNGDAPAPISVGASPFTWTSIQPEVVEVYIGGGIVSEIDKNGQSIASGLTLTGLSTVLLQTNETVTVTYTAPPVMSWSAF